jgi:hypothetical protein
MAFSFMETSSSRWIGGRIIINNRRLRPEALKVRFGQSLNGKAVPGG